MGLHTQVPVTLRLPSTPCCRGRHDDRRRGHSSITAAVRSPQREVKMVPLYLPEEQRTSAAAPSSPAPSTQQRSGADSRTRNGAQSSGAGTPRKQGGVQQQQQQQQRTGVSVPSAARAPAQVQQRQDDAAPATSPGSAGSRSLSSNARVQQFGRGFNGVDAQTMAAQPPVESAADVAAEMLTQTRSGQVLVEAEMSELGPVEPPLSTDFTWSRESYSRWQRTISIWSSLATLRTRLWLAENKRTYPGGFTPAKQSVRRRRTAAWLRGALLQLGPTFIKLGQLFSTRSDLLPPEFTEELALLQDRVPAFPVSRARAIFEAQLGAPPEELFAAFDEQPLAAASLGQVHRAQLRDGTEVVVKVQRPGLEELFEIDLEELGKVAAFVDSQDEGRRDLRGIHKEVSTILYQEIDYLNEGRNADRFRRNFQGIDWVESPVVHWGYTSARVITLSYLPGIKITNIQQLSAAGLDTGAIARRATEAYLLQILRHGFLHADPHPGNLAVGTRGQLLFYDFGMMSSTAGSREKLLDVFYGIYRQDTQQVIKALIDLKIIVPTADLFSIRRSLDYFLKNFQQATQREETIANIGEDLFAIALDQPFRFPATFTFVLRAFSTLEGLGKALDPNYSFSDVAKPYALELLNLQDAQQAQGFVLERLQERAVQVGSDAAAMPTRIATIDSALGQLQSGEVRLRTRVLESERADRRQAVLQGTTVGAVGVAGLANIATQFGLAGHSGMAWAAGLAAAACGAVVYRGLWRVKRLDNFEKQIKL